MIKKNLYPKPVSLPQYCDFFGAPCRKTLIPVDESEGFFFSTNSNPRHDWNLYLCVTLRQTRTKWLRLAHKERHKKTNTQRQTHKDKHTKTDTQRHAKTNTQRQTHKDKHAKIRSHPPAAILVALLQILKACLVQQIWLKPHCADQFPLPIKKIQLRLNLDSRL